jgi:hypothetical protein
VTAVEIVDVALPPWLVVSVAGLDTIEKSGGAVTVSVTVVVCVALVPVPVIVIG